MKKAALVLILAVVAGSFWFFTQQSTVKTPENAQAGNSSAPAQMANKATQSESVDGGAQPSAIEGNTSEDVVIGDDDEGIVDESSRSASEVYKNADEALAAVKNAAATYDDVILEQFTQPGEDCTWCGEFYRGLTETMLNQATSADQRSYFAEILAVSGRPDNVRTLIDAIEKAPKLEEAEVYAEALELTVGKDDVTALLGEKLSSTQSDTLKESLVAALSNQGTQQAAEQLYKQTVTGGDPDGYYSRGIGLGELIPQEDAMPYLQELASKRDNYSHLAVKALLNGGVDGLKRVFDILSVSSDADADKALLKDAVDHISYDEEAKAYVMRFQNEKDTVRGNFARQILASFDNSDEEGDTELGTDEVSADSDGAPLGENKVPVPPIPGPR